MKRLIFTAKVVSTKDPEDLGRVQVELPGFKQAVELPWIRMVHPHASASFGSFVLPEVDDEVMILRGDGNSIDHLICLGSVYNGSNTPNTPDSDGKNNTKEFRTRTGNRITIWDEEGKETIQISTPDDKQTLIMDAKNGLIKMETTKTIKILVPDGDIFVECKTADVKASKTVTVKADMEVSVTGTQKVEVKGTNIDILGDAKVTVKGGAMVVVKGGMVRIN